VSYEQDARIESEGIPYKDHVFYSVKEAKDFLGTIAKTERWQV
jgi:hypothetical protein